MFIQDYTPTVEDFNWVEYEVNGGLFMLQIIDLSGSHDFLAMRNLYIRTVDAFLLVFALDDMSSFEEMVQLYTEIKSQNTRNAKIQVVATKTDLFDSEDEWNVTRRSINGFITGNRASLAEISVRETETVQAFVIKYIVIFRAL